MRDNMEFKRVCHYMREYPLILSKSPLFALQKNEMAGDRGQKPKAYFALINLTTYCCAAERSDVDSNRFLVAVILL